ncbi:MAG: tocopherol cyclase family protein [Spirochaetaceae bacterium]
MNNPILYQGKNRKNNYFEGWYFKVANESGDKVFAVIPGISKEIQDPHSFIQINDNCGFTEYYKFDLDDINFISGSTLKIIIKDNLFSLDNIILNLPNITCNIKFSNQVKYNGIWPNIMGPFSFIPFMQCYHGVGLINSRVDGEIKILDKVTSYNNGKGYIEKDYGSGFPKEWIWLQGNSFKEKQISIMMSLAHIPWLGSYFPGFLGFIHVDDKTHYFSTYNGSKVLDISVGEYLEIEFKKRDYRLKIKTKQVNSGILKAPVKGSMNRLIKESVNSNIDIKFYKKSILIFSGTTKAGGLEIVGDVQSIFIKNR